MQQNRSNANRSACGPTYDLHKNWTWVNVLTLFNVYCPMVSENTYRDHTWAYSPNVSVIVQTFRNNSKQLFVFEVYTLFDRRPSLTIVIGKGYNCSVSFVS